MEYHLLGSLGLVGFARSSPISDFDTTRTPATASGPSVSRLAAVVVRAPEGV